MPYCNMLHELISVCEALLESVEPVSLLQTQLLTFLPSNPVNLSSFTLPSSLSLSIALCNNPLLALLFSCVDVENDDD